MGVIIKMLPEVRASIATRKERKKAQIEVKEQKEVAIVQEKKSVPYKLGKIEEQLKTWNTKLKRAQNSIKKLQRRKKIYEKKQKERTHEEVLFQKKQENETMIEHDLKKEG